MPSAFFVPYAFQLMSLVSLGKLSHSSISEADPPRQFWPKFWSKLKLWDTKLLSKNSSLWATQRRSHLLVPEESTRARSGLDYVMVNVVEVRGEMPAGLDDGLTRGDSCG